MKFPEFLPAGSAAGSSAGIVFTHGPIFGFLTRCTEQGDIWHGVANWEKIGILPI